MFTTQYAQPVTRKGTKAADPAAEKPEEKKLSNHVQRDLDARKVDAKIDTLLDSQFAAGRLYATISSRPGQSGRADGYILEGKELEVLTPYSPSMINHSSVPLFLVLLEEVEDREAKACAISGVNVAGRWSFVASVVYLSPLHAAHLSLHVYAPLRSLHFIHCMNNRILKPFGVT